MNKKLFDALVAFEKARWQQSTDVLHECIGIECEEGGSVIDKLIEIEKGLRR